ncbi:MAG: diaminopimelate epimerase [Candidatus Margulisiibacteriota bacterium]
MAIKFSKYHGCGNDFICVDARQTPLDFVNFATHYCQRGFSVGGDGALFLLDSKVADFKMMVVNADGSEPEMCGNGLRCFVAYLYHQKLTTKLTLTIETGAGILNCQILDPNYPSCQILIEMGQAKLQSTLPTQDFGMNVNLLSHDLVVDGTPLSLIPIGMGNPHAVIFVSDVDAFDLARFGPVIEQHPWFPNRVNVEFIQRVSENELKMRVWERGVGETNACGTGACAAVVAGVLSGQNLADATVQLKGGQLAINYNQETHEVFMTGPAEFVYQSNLMD